MKKKVIKALIELGYSKEVATELIEKYIDVYEINVDDDQTPESIAESIEEAHLQDDEGGIC